MERKQLGQGCSGWTQHSNLMWGHRDEARGMCPFPHLLLQGCFRWRPAQVAWPWKSWLLLKVGTNFERLINARAPAGRTRPSVAQAGRSRLTNTSTPCHTNNGGSDNTSVRLFQSCNNAGWSWRLAGMEDMKVLSSPGKMFIGLLGSPALPGTAGNCSQVKPILLAAVWDIQGH